MVNVTIVIMVIIIILSISEFKMHLRTNIYKNDNNIREYTITSL